MNESPLNRVLLHPKSLGLQLDEWLAGNGGVGLENALAQVDSILSKLKTLI